MLRLWIAVAMMALPVWHANADTLAFKNSCEQGEELRIAAVGDLIFHKQLLAQIFNRRRPVKSFWSPVQHIFDKADITYGNLEGPVAPRITMNGRTLRHDRQVIDYRVYGYKLESLSFNFPPAVLDGLKASGFDVISTANNHALDRGAIGADLTIDGLRKRELSFSGTRKRNEDVGDRAVIISRKGFRTAWLACTYSTNGKRDRHTQVTHCYKHKPEILAELKRHAADPKVDAVFLTPHWGQENHYRPTARQRQLGRDAIDAGALAVIGAHPHVVQPWEKHITTDDREGLIIYSTGNFLSNQRQLMQRAGVIATLVLKRSPRTDGNASESDLAKRKAWISGVGYVPTWVVIDGKGHRTTENTGQHKTVLKWTGRILPSGNRVTGSQPFLVPKTCGPTAITSATLAAGRLSLRSSPAVQSTSVRKTLKRFARKTRKVVSSQRRTGSWRRQILDND